jgi:hypothetical protein
LTDFHLNGISFEIVNYNTTTGDIQLQIKYNDVDIVNDQRLTGQVQLSDIVAGSANDSVIKTGKKLIIDHSGTPNRETKGPLLPNGQHTYPDFVTPTYLQINAGATLLIENQAELIVNPKSTLIIKSGANVIVQGSGRIDVKDNAFICIEPGANVQLVNPASRIFVRQTATIGSNPTVSLATPTSGCLTRCELQNLFATNGSFGQIDNTFLQFTAGNDITAYGDAIGYSLGSASGPAGNYLWMPSQYFLNPTSKNPVISGLTHDQVFTVKYTNPSGCFTFDTVQVRALDKSIVQIHSDGNQCNNGFSYTFSGVDLDQVAFYEWDLGPNASTQNWYSTSPQGISFNALGTQQVVLTITFFNGVIWKYTYEENIWYLSCCNTYTGTITQNNGVSYEGFVGSGNGVPAIYGGGIIDGTLHVDGALTLTEGHYYINPNAILHFTGDWNHLLQVVKSKLIIQNATVRISNATFTNDCGQMWWGIEVKDGSHITMDASTVENSYNGLYFDQRNVLCGFQIVNSNFNNNLLSSIENNTHSKVMPPGNVINQSFFNGNSSTMLQPYNNGSYYPMNFVMLRGDIGDYQTVRIENNVFGNAFNGVCVYGALATIGASNNFADCYKSAIHVSGKADVTGSSFSIPLSAPVMPQYPHTLSNELATAPAPTGVYLHALLSTATSTISSNQFTPSTLLAGTFPMQFGIYGNYANHAGGVGYTVSDNTFQYVTTGISDKGVGYATSHITGNQFYNNEKGFELRQGNSTPSNPAKFQIKCNDFVKDQPTPGVRTYGIFIANGATLNAQGGCPNINLGTGLEAMANNEFLSDGYPLQYFNNGTLSVFAPEYDWFNDFYGIANINSTALSYTAAGNENLGLLPTVQFTGTTTLFCGTQQPISSPTSTCPSFFGVANRGVKVKKDAVSLFSLYPNPGNGVFTIKVSGNQSVKEVEVLNTLGELVYFKSLDEEASVLQFDLTAYELPSGVYILKLSGEGGYSERINFVLIR